MKPTVAGVGVISKDTKVRFNGVLDKAYDCWTSMIYRCYDEKTQKRQPTYIGCLVCDKWKIFENFRDWYYENYPKDGESYCLDKDKKIKGNKLYSPDTCVFITKKENSLIATGCNGRIVYFRAPDGTVIKTDSVARLEIDLGLYRGSLAKVVSGSRKSCKGYKLIKVEG